MRANKQSMGVITILSFQTLWSATKTGNSKILTTGGESGAVVYWGEVHDKDSGLVGDFLDFSKDALAAWERLFASLGITLS